MLDIINRLSHGYVSIPVILALRRGCLFEYLKKNTPCDLETLAKDLNANEGYLHTALRLLSTLGFVVEDHTRNYSIKEIPSEIEAIPENILSFYTFNIKDCLSKGKNAEELNQWLSLANDNWNIAEGLISNFLNGVLIVPIILAIYNEELVSFGEVEQSLTVKIDKKVSANLFKFFAKIGWVELNGDSVRFTSVGNYIFQRSLNFGVSASYSLMLANIDKLIFGNYDGDIFKRDNFGFEHHVDRKLNVLASGFQHKRFFSDLGEAVLSIFNKEPFTQQPDYVVDMGCGDGTLLKYLYEIILKNSKRGKVLDQYPLIMVGLDYNAEALTIAAQTLSQVPHAVLQADISDPEKMLNDLARIGICNPEKMLHVRTFLDHNRHFEPCSNKISLKKYDSHFYDGAYVDQDGNTIPPKELIANLREHLQAWQRVVSNYGLILFEVHSLAPAIVFNIIDEIENLHFDACHAFSGQYLVDAHIFLKVAAEVGLFSDQKFFKKHPQFLPYSRITLHYFKKKNYQIRQASLDDLPVLANIEQRSWSPELQVTKGVIESRINNFPEGQFVLEQHNKIMGAIYTQRINSIEVLDQVKFDDLWSISDHQGKILQLIGISILPEFQHQGLGKQLLQYVLQYASLYAGIEKVVGVTRTRKFVDQNILTMSEYMASNDKDGKLFDPVLYFHESCGASIVKIIENYRLQDIDNHGAGILIEYNIHENCGPKIEDLPDAKISSASIDNKELIRKKVQDCLSSFSQDLKEFSTLSDLLNAGLDSLDLMALRTSLSRTFNEDLSRNFLLIYPSVDAMVEYFFQKNSSRINNSRKLES